MCLVLPILTSLFAPVGQFAEDVVVKLACQTRKLLIALCVGTVTGSAGRNIGGGNSLFIDFLSRRYEILWRAAERFWIKFVKIRDKGLLHCRGQNVSHVKHDVVRPPALSKGLQLIRQIFGLLSREPWHRIICA